MDEDPLRDEPDDASVAACACFPPSVIQMEIKLRYLVYDPAGKVKDIREHVMTVNEDRFVEYGLDRLAASVVCALGRLK